MREKFNIFFHITKQLQRKKFINRKREENMARADDIERSVEYWNIFILIEKEKSGAKWKIQFKVFLSDGGKKTIFLASFSIRSGESLICSWENKSSEEEANGNMLNITCRLGKAAP